MNENEENAFRAVYEFYKKWRETIIETQEQWDRFADDVGKTITAMDVNPLGFRLMTAVLDHINDLYRDGMKPMPAGYFGRDDL